MNKKIKDIFNLIKDRFSDYDNNRKDYSFSINLKYDAKGTTDTRHTIRGVGAETFDQRFNNALTFSPKPDTIEILEFDGEDSDAEIQEDFTQLIRIKAPRTRVATRKKAESPPEKKEPEAAPPEQKPEPLTGLMGLDEIVDVKVSEFKHAFEIAELKRTNETVVAEIKRQLKESEESVSWLEAELDKADGVVRTLEGDVETAKAEKFKLGGLPIGTVAADLVTSFLKKNPAALSGFGVSSESVQAALSGDVQAAANENKYDAPMAQLRTFVEALTPEHFEAFWAIINVFAADQGKIIEVTELLTGKTQ